jgi:nucleoside-diphosphate-sugar epimerase
MKVLLTGANGFVGSHVLDRLCAGGFPTVILLRSSANQRFIEKRLPQVEIRTGSLNDQASLDNAMRDVTHVIHTAGCVRASRAREFFDVNQMGTRAVVDAINRQQGRVERVVHISSLAASGPATCEKPATETDLPQPVSEYGKSKLAAEKEVQDNCKARYVMLRPPAVYGPRDTEFLRLFKALKSHLLPRIGGGRQKLSFVYVKDLAEVIVACLDHASVRGRTYFVCGPEIISSGALAEEIAALLKTWTVPLLLPNAALWPICLLQEFSSRLTGAPSVLNRLKYPELVAPAWTCSPQRLAQEAGLTCPTSLKSGLSETLSWYQEQGWL